jgi:cytochrome c-type biogenesis protein CcmH
VTGLIVACGLMLAGALGLLVAPLLRATAAPGGSGGAVYRDQLAELEREIAAGLVGAEEAEPARLEIARRLLAVRPEAVPSVTPLPVLALILALVVGAGTTGLYLRLGSPGLPDAPIAAREAREDGAHVDISRLVAALGARLRATPDDAEGWLLYARTLASLGRWPEAADAFRHRIALGGADAATSSALGEMLVLSAGGTLTGEARDAFTRALAADPADPVARFYAAEALLEGGEPDRALEAWRRLAADSADPDLRATIGKRVAAAARLAGKPDPGLPPPAAGR